MISEPRRRFLALVTLLGLAGLLAPLFNRSPSFNAALYMIASSFVSLELVDLAVRLFLARRHSDSRADLPPPDAYPVRPYAVVLSVRNLLPELDVITGLLEPYKYRVWIIDDASTDATPLFLKAMGWRCVTSSRNTKKPGALRRLLSELPREIETVLVLDPDAVPRDRGNLAIPALEAALRRFQRSGAMACCPRIRICEGGTLESFQTVECELAFALGRKGLSPHTITSGVAIYNRRALERVLDRHSLSVYAEDLENMLLLLSAGEKIVCDEEICIETHGKSDVAGWFSQRVGWSYGLLRVLIERRAELLAVARVGPWTFYNFAVYLAGFTVLLLPVKALGILLLLASLANGIDELLALSIVPDGPLTNPTYFAATFFTYALLLAGVLAALRPRLRSATLLIAVPFYLCYAVFHVLPMAVGYANWLTVRLRGRRLYRDHYSDEPAGAGLAAAPR
jgi:cellulose synthase/poly-beta-1,6-N-acetylglucosamine synthase-like glycosyltransferase